MTEQELREMNNKNLLRLHIHAQNINKVLCVMIEIRKQRKQLAHQTHQELLRRLEYYEQYNNSQVPTKEHYY